jgi:hypothetical protein
MKQTRITKQRPAPPRDDKSEPDPPPVTDKIRKTWFPEEDR